MKKQSNIQVTVPKPCHENWQEMTAADKGRFCQSCQKTVIDFSQLSDNRIVHLIQESKGELCGRFTRNQLNRTLEPHKVAPPWVNKAAGFLVASLLTGSSLQAQHFDRSFPVLGKIAPIEQSEQTTSENQASNELHETRIFEGVVVNEQDEPIPFATIFLPGSAVGTTGDVNGRFRLEIKEAALQQAFTNQLEEADKYPIASNLQQIRPHLVISFLGYEEQYLPIAKTPIQSYSRVVLKEALTENGELLVLGIMIVESAGKKNLLGRMKDKIQQWLGGKDEEIEVYESEIEEVTSRDLNELEVSLDVSPSTPTPQPTFTIQPAYPNPFQDQIRLSVHTQTADQLTFDLINVDGRRVYTQHEMVEAGEQAVVIQLPKQAWPNGTYFLRIRNKIVAQELQTLIKMEDGLVLKP